MPRSVAERRRLLLLYAHVHTNKYVATREERFVAWTFSEIQYEVLLVGSLDKHATSSVWIMLTGSLGSSQNVPLPPNGIQFTFDVSGKKCADRRGYFSTKTLVSCPR